MNRSKALFIEEHRDAIENLSEGQIFSAFDFPITYSYDFENEIRSSQPAYMIYLGPDKRPHAPWNHIRFLTILKNGDTIVTSENRGEIETYLDKGWIKKSNNRTQLLQEIKNYLPERQAKEKENVQIVGSEVKIGESATRVDLPPEIKNNLLSFLGRYPDEENRFPNDYINEYSKKDDKDDNQKAGRRRKKTRKSKKSRKTRKSRKSRKSRKH